MEEQPIKQQPSQGPAEEPAEERQKPEVQENESKYVKYICAKCNYKFSRRRTSSASLRCPYCGSKNVSEDTFNLNRLIDES